MEPTYTVQGGDGQQYGPASLEELRNWIREGRVKAETQVWRSDQAAWTTAGQLPELAAVTPGSPPLAPALPAPGATSRRAFDPEAEGRIRNGASWFYWVAALSFLNSVGPHLGLSLQFSIGLGVTRLIDAFLQESTAVALVFDVAAVALLVVFGIFGGKRQSWAFLVGGLLLLLDTLLVTVLALKVPGLWLSVAFHAWALFSIFRGFQAVRSQSQP